MLDSSQKQTTTEIAKLCSVSRATVSAVLNGKPGVRPKTRQKVLDCIRKHNIDTGMMAKTLVGEFSRMIVILVVDMANPFYADMFGGISSVLSAEHYHMLYQPLRYEDPENKEALQAIFKFAPAGFIVHCGLEGGPAHEFIRLSRPDIPVVTVEHIEGMKTHAVVFDNRKASRLVADYLLDRGHRQLAYFAGPPASDGARERKLGVVESTIAHELPLENLQILEMGDTAERGYELTLKLFRNARQHPTALLCFNDFVAMGVYRALHELELRVPDDVSVVGFDDVSVASLMAPPLTTVSISPRRLGQEAASLVLRAIRHETGKELLTTSVEPKLIERASVRSLNKESRRILDTLSAPLVEQNV